jgi:ADP-heptose:LPS heptosyltransferase
MSNLLNAKNILICLRWGIGDLVMETQALDALRSHVPTAHIIAIGAVPATELLEGDPRLDGGCTYQGFEITHWGDEGSPAKRKKFVQWMQRMQFDAILDPSHAPLAIGRMICENGGVIFDAPDRRPDPVLQGGGSCIEAINSVVRQGWGICIPEGSNPRIHLSRKAETWAEEFLRSRLPGDRPIIAISPGASSALKTWPIAKFKELCRKLCNRGFDLIVFCGPSRPLPYVFIPCIEQTDRKMVFLGNIHLLHAASLLSRCNALVCNDTGLMHIAASVGTPVVGIFGPTDPSVYLPRRPKSFSVVPEHSECRYRRTFSIGPTNCVLSNRCSAGDEPCISKIEVRDVLSAIDQFSVLYLHSERRERKIS